MGYTVVLQSSETSFPNEMTGAPVPDFVSAEHYTKCLMSIVAKKEIMDSLKANWQSAP